MEAVVVMPKVAVIQAALNRNANLAAVYCSRFPTGVNICAMILV